jgi:hypothetical protein
MPDFRLIFTDDRKLFESEIRQALKDGWQLSGSHQVNLWQGNGWHFSQALIKPAWECGARAI